MNPESNPVGTDTSDSKILLFKIEQGIFCIDLGVVNRVIYMTETQPVPGMPPYFIGLLNLHNEKIPVIDLSIKLQIRDESQYTVNTPIILCQNETCQVGFIVDETIDVENFTMPELKAQNLFKGDAAAYLQGSIHTDHGEVLLFSPQKIFEEKIIKVD
ncbi:MAG: hypothetical protein COB66_08770 [Coxiella sp. (in: Bacteria)]|nr:MAG: hypothetical protein COB66_08770 [Coxiella sp. (in: g-proteobacteria)]